RRSAAGAGASSGPGARQATPPARMATVAIHSRASASVSNGPPRGGVPGTNRSGNETNHLPAGDGLEGDMTCPSRGSGEGTRPYREKPTAGRPPATPRPPVGGLG